VWFGDAAKVHWGLPDPSTLEGSEEGMRAAFFDMMARIEQRIYTLLELGLEELPKEERQMVLNNLVEE
jgi:arsenate reductase